MRVPVSGVLAGFGDGWRLAMDTLGHERSGYAMRRRRENQVAFIDLVDALRAAGAADDPHVRELLGDLGALYVALRTFEAQSHDTAARLAAGEVPSPLDSLDKLTLTATEQQLYAFAAEALGAERMTIGARPHGLDAHDLMRGLLYARSASVYGGSSQIQRGIVAERALGLPRARA